MEQTFKHKPVVSTDLTPREILGFDYDAFITWFKTPRSTQTSQPPEKRKRAAGWLDDLHRHGYVPLGFKDDGTIDWRIRTHQRQEKVK